MVRDVSDGLAVAAEKSVAAMSIRSPTVKGTSSPSTPCSKLPQSAKLTEFSLMHDRVVLSKKFNTVNAFAVTPLASRSATALSTPPVATPRSYLDSPRQEAVAGLDKEPIFASPELSCVPGGSARCRSQPSSPTGTGVFLGGRYSLAFGGVPVAGVSEMRSSERIRDQPNATDTQLERAMKIAQDRDPGRRQLCSCRYEEHISIFY
jgi:hypothetical protein